MAGKPKSPAFTSVEANALRATILRPPRHIFTDPIEMEHVLETDQVLGKQLLAQRLETPPRHVGGSGQSCQAAKVTSDG